MYYCTKCKLNKEETEFYPSQIICGGICKVCFNNCPSQTSKGKKKYRQDNPDKVKEWKQKDYTQNRKQYIWRQARERAEERNLEFTITLDDIQIPSICPILGIPILYTAGEGRTGNSPSIDRIDNTKGYTLDNILVVSDRANILKKDSTEEEREKMFYGYQKLLIK